jgi:hypothetical protein
MLLGTDPSRDQVILHAMGQGEVVVARSGDITILDESEMEMAIEAFLNFAYILDLCDSTNGNLFALVAIANWTTHCF